jgi:hypothetical protein
MKARPILVVAALAALVAAGPGRAQDPAAPAPDTGGFYGGVALRSSGVDEGGVNLGRVASAWGRFASPVSDDTTNRALLYGGYRFANHVAVEGSLATADRYALQPLDAAAPRGVGLSLGTTPAASPARTWNADVYTSWSIRKTVALYGRLGYAQSDNVPHLRTGDAADQRCTTAARRDELRRGRSLRFLAGAGAAPRVRALQPVRR